MGSRDATEALDSSRHGCLALAQGEARRFDHRGVAVVEQGQHRVGDLTAMAGRDHRPPPANSRIRVDQSRGDVIRSHGPESFDGSERGRPHGRVVVVQ
ncbi:MAG: hypothetical protein JJLCMIEE_02743 [Acidimicrobiales bacterium]|nr:hypothetical protein [Acidimicrobiales bacterium]